MPVWQYRFLGINLSEPDFLLFLLRVFWGSLTRSLQNLKLAQGETVSQTAIMISFLTEVIGIRDDMFLGVGHEYMKEVGKAISNGFSN